MVIPALPLLKQAVGMTQPEQPHPASLLTRADYERYRGHLQELRRVRDRDLPELLRDARGFVASDAEEEIAQIREDHVFVEARIAHLEALLRDAHVVADSEAPDVAFPAGSWTWSTPATASWRRTGSPAPAAPAAGARCPPARRSGKASIGRARGDLVSVELPDGATRNCASSL